MANAHLPPSPGQTVGPFFHFGLIYPRSNELVDAGAPGAIRLHGAVRDGDGAPVPDALVEVWQARPDGSAVEHGGHIARDGTFSGFGRAATDREGLYWFRTLEPGATAAGGAAFFAVTVFARGLLDRLFTRAYVPSDALAADPLLSSLDEAARATLVAVRDGDASLRFDIALQGAAQTAFLDHDAPGDSRRNDE